MGTTIKEKQVTALNIFLIFFGTIVGAGFASGREIYVYFARFGISGLVITFFAGILFYFLGYVFLQLGKRCKVKNLSHFFKLIFGRFAPIVEIIVIFSYIIVLGAMFAGFDSLQHIVSKDLNYPILAILSALFCVFVVLGGISKISKINGFLLPILLLFMLAIFVFSLKNCSLNCFKNLSVIDTYTVVYSLISGLIFVCSNMFLTGFVLMQVGFNSTRKTNKIASFITGLVIFLVSFFACLTIIANPDSIQYDMPFVYLAFGISDFFIILSVIILWFAIFTTAVATMLTISWWLNGYINNNLLSTTITCVVSFLLSRVGFSIIIDTFYPITGLMDIIFVMCALFLYFKNSKNKTKITNDRVLYNKKIKISINYLEE